MALPHDARPMGFLFVADMARACDFYRRLLGAEGSPDAFGATLTSPAGLVRLTPAPEGWSAGPHPVYGWHVGDIAQGVNALVAAGVTPVIYEGFGQDARGVWTSPDGAARVLWFHDSEGNLLSLTKT